MTFTVNMDPFESMLPKHVFHKCAKFEDALNWMNTNIVLMRATAKMQRQAKGIVKPIERRFNITERQNPNGLDEIWATYTD